MAAKVQYIFSEAGLCRKIFMRCFLLYHQFNDVNRDRLNLHTFQVNIPDWKKKISQLEFFLKTKIDDKVKDQSSTDT